MKGQKKALWIWDQEIEYHIAMIAKLKGEGSKYVEKLNRKIFKVKRGKSSRESGWQRIVRTGQ